jgi:hypothetical protein
MGFVARVSVRQIGVDIGTRFGERSLQLWQLRKMCRDVTEQIVELLYPRHQCFRRGKACAVLFVRITLGEFALRFRVLRLDLGDSRG